MKHSRIIDSSFGYSNLKAVRFVTIKPTLGVYTMIDLRGKAVVLAQKFEEICVKYPDIKGHVFAKDGKQEVKPMIVVNLFHLYDERRHSGREFELCGIKSLASPRVLEEWLIVMVVLELAGEEFHAENGGTTRGYFSYYLFPKA